MKISASILLCLLAIGLQAQHSISGNFSPTKDFKWLIAYELTPGSQRYIVDTAVKDGYFNFKLPVTAQAGIYRLVYAIPQDEFYIDVIYNKKEDIEFNFSLENGINFIRSKENQLYTGYFTKISKIETQLLNFYETEKTSKNEFKEICELLRNTQESFENLAVGSIAYQFIKANKTYVPENFEPIETYIQQKKIAYFEYLDVKNTLLQASSFLTDKISNYAFSALAPNVFSREVVENQIKENIKRIQQELAATSSTYQFHIHQNLWNLANASQLNSTADFIYESYLKQLAMENGNLSLIDEIEAASRLRLGAKSPEIIWENGGTRLSLADLKESDNYVLIFWSSSCSHCLKEVPQLHKGLKKHPKVKVLAVGLEDDTANWKKEVSKLPDFEHAIALGKWESDYAKLFAIDKTPTYFILDSDKRIISKPESDGEVIEFLRKE